MITYKKVQQPWLWKFPFRLLKVLLDTVVWLLCRFIEVVGLIVVVTMLFGLLGGPYTWFIESLAQPFVFHPVTALAEWTTGVIFAYGLYLAVYVTFMPSKKFVALLESLGNKIGESAHSVFYAIYDFPVIKKWSVQVGGFIGNHKRLINVSAWSVASLGLAGLLYTSWWLNVHTVPASDELPPPPHAIQRTTQAVKNPDHALLDFMIPGKALPNGPTFNKQVVVRGAAVIKPLGHDRYSIHFTRENMQKNPW